MPEWRLAHLDDLEPDAGRRVEFPGGAALALFRTDSGVSEPPEVYALVDRCTHEEEPLSDGFVEGGQIECAAHGSCFDLATGEVLAAPALEPVRTFPVTVRDGDVLVDLPEDWVPGPPSG
jgi:nitrite reductase/ring-hydroxylating ferredoxin subunit